MFDVIQATAKAKAEKAAAEEAQKAAKGSLARAKAAQKVEAARVELANAEIAAAQAELERANQALREASPFDRAEAVKAQSAALAKLTQAQAAAAQAREAKAAADRATAAVSAAQAVSMWQPTTVEPTTMQKVQILKQVGGSWEMVVDCAAQFNPTKLQLSKKASWKTEKTWKSNVGNTTFTGGDPISLSVDLFFDTTTTGGDVRQYTSPLMDLTMVDLVEATKWLSEEDIKKQIEGLEKSISGAEEGTDTSSLKRQVEDLKKALTGKAAGTAGAPPKCKFVWGSFSFLAIVESVNVTFTMFLPNGTPVRATAKMKMKQIEEQALYPPQNPTTRNAARKMWVVREGQTLDWIAYQEYGDPALWRYIAQTNNLDNPRDLRPGQVLDL